LVLRLLRAAGYGKAGQRGQAREDEGGQATPLLPSPPPKKQRDLRNRGALHRAKPVFNHWPPSAIPFDEAKRSYDAELMVWAAELASDAADRIEKALAP
jgi:hypothetical protein